MRHNAFCRRHFSVKRSRKQRPLPFSGLATHTLKIRRRKMLGKDAVPVLVSADVPHDGHNKKTHWFFLKRRHYGMFSLWLVSNISPRPKKQTLKAFQIGNSYMTGTHMSLETCFQPSLRWSRNVQGYMVFIEYQSHQVPENTSMMAESLQSTAPFGDVPPSLGQRVPSFSPASRSQGIHQKGWKGVPARSCRMAGA